MNLYQLQNQTLKTKTSRWPKRKTKSKNKKCINSTRTTLDTINHKAKMLIDGASSKRTIFFFLFETMKRELCSYKGIALMSSLTVQINAIKCVQNPLVLQIESTLFVFDKTNPLF